jgi:hypothetical protein
MSQADEVLKGAIAELRQELAALDAGDTSARARIEPLLAKLEAQAGAEHHAARESIGDAVREFEVQHPTLTAALERVLLALSSMGI